MISFSHPAYLLLLALVPYLVAVSRRSLSGLRPARAGAALGLRVGIAVLLVLALAGVQVNRPSKKLAVLFILDRSDSIPSDRRDAGVRFVNQATAHMSPNDSAGVIVFGAEPVIEYLPRFGLKVGEITSVYSRDYTDIGAALRLALAAMPGDAQKRIVLVSDGNENLGSAVEEAVGAASASVQIDTVPVTYHYDREVLLEKLELPSEVKEGEPFELKVLVNSTADADVKLRLFRDDQLIGEQTVKVLKGKTPLSIAQTLTKPGFHRYEAAIEATPDTLPDNNRTLGFTRVQGMPTVLYVEGNARDGKFLAAALRQQRVKVELRDENQIPTNLAEFQNYDSIVLSNVGAWKLSPDQMKMIQSNVRDLGAGLVMVGGERSFGAGAYGGTPVEAALPVDMDVQKKKNMPTGAVAMVMHTCEFPDGNKWMAETAAAVVDALGERDKVGLLLYDAGERWGIPMQPATNKERIKQAIFTLGPGDMPSFATIMQMAYDGLRQADAQVKHVIVISDGDPSPPSPGLIKKMVQSKITVSTVAVFPHGNLTATMRDMATLGKGRFYNVRSADEIPRIFLKEAQYVLKPAIIEEPFYPAVDADSPLLRGIGTGRIPPLLGYVATTPKGMAAVVMRSKRDDPVLATWQYGLGKAVAFTSDAKNRWAAQWVEWPGFAKFWAQVVRWTVRSTSRTNFETNVEIARQKGKVTIDALDAKGDFINFLDLKGNVVSPKMRSLKLSLRQTAPGRYEGTFDAPEVGQYIISVAYKDARGRQRLHTAGAAVPYSPEYRELQANEATLIRLAEVTHGRVYPALGAQVKEDPSRVVFRRERRAATAPQDLWPALLLMAALFFPLDVGIRRLMIDPAEALAYLRLVLARVHGRLSRRAQRRVREREAALGRLLAAKEAAAGRLGQPEEQTPPAPELVTTPVAGIATASVEAAADAGAPAAPQPQPGVVWHRPVPGVTPRPAPDRPSPERRTGTETPAEPAAAPEGGHTGRLLDAKRRAREKKD